MAAKHANPPDDRPTTLTDQVIDMVDESDSTNVFVKSHDTAPPSTGRFVYRPKAEAGNFVANGIILQTTCDCSQQQAIIHNGDSYCRLADVYVVIPPPPNWSKTRDVICKGYYSYSADTTPGETRIKITPP